MASLRLRPARVAIQSLPAPPATIIAQPGAGVNAFLIVAGRAALFQDAP